MVIIGVDCATKQENTGLARGHVDKGGLAITDVKIGSGNTPAVAVIQRWLQKGQPALLALDAPLGWPLMMGKELHKHCAGMPIECKADYMFSRETDRNVRDRIGKRPLEVGANLIARTAHSALKLLQDLRAKTGFSIPLVWDTKGIGQPCAIEVYPAATLAALGIKAGAYKKKGGQASHERAENRAEIVNKLQKHLHIRTSHRTLLTENDDAIDAVVCALGGFHFISGKCLPPSDIETVHKEGWIWVYSSDI